MEKDKVKVFSFDGVDGVTIIAAKRASQAITVYFDECGGEDEIEEGGVEIREVTGAALDKEHLIFDESLGLTIKVSYRQLVEDEYEGAPLVLVTPNY